MFDPIVIVSAKRTPNGVFQGIFSNVSATDLGAKVIKSTIPDNIDLSTIDEVIMGCVLSAGLGQAPARQAVLKAGLPNNVRSLTVNKVCGSGLEAVRLGCNLINLDEAKVVIAGGMESMSNAPYLSLNSRKGIRMGHDTLIDHMLYDGLQDNLSNGTLMGVFAERTAEKYKFSRQNQDEFAINSANKARTAYADNAFNDELLPIKIMQKKKEQIVTQDETLEKVKIDKISTLKPAFVKDGTVTAANSSSISDGASAVLLMRKSHAKDLNLKILATIVSYANHAQKPEWFTTAPVGAIHNVLQKSNWNIKDIDLFEINEAFAVVTMACTKDLCIPENKVNIHGGSCALGHPIGSSGSRVLTTLIHALHKHKKNRGIASLCIGGGEAVAMTIEITE